MANYIKKSNLCCAPLPLREKYRTSEFLSLRKKYRSDFEIIALMLEAVKDNSATRFSILKYTNINSAQLKKYLRSLVEMGFIEMDIKAGQVSYRTSEKGIDFLRQYYVLLMMLLGKHTRNESISVAYEVSNGQQRSITHVTQLQHTPQPIE